MHLDCRATKTTNTVRICRMLILIASPREEWLDELPQYHVMRKIVCLFFSITKSCLNHIFRIRAWSSLTRKFRAPLCDEESELRLAILKLFI